MNLITLCSSYQVAFLMQFYIYTASLKRSLQIILPIMWGETTWLNSQDNRWIGLSPPNLCHTFTIILAFLQQSNIVNTKKDRFLSTANNS